MEMDKSYLCDLLQDKCKLARQIEVSEGCFTDLRTYFVTIDSLDSKDYPNNIARNSIYIEFKVDMIEKKVELFGYGHIYLSPYDKTTPKYKYLCMRNIISLGVEVGIKKFRKQSFKNLDDLSEKMSNYYNSIMDLVCTYTSGYPYKEGVLETPLTK